jgi:hypothetical protein
MNPGRDKGGTPDWNEFCRRYVDTVSAFNRTAAQGPQAGWPFAPWAGVMAPDVAQQPALFGPLAGLMGNFITQLGAAAATPDWQSALRSAVENFKQQAAMPASWSWPDPGSAAGTGAPDRTLNPDPELQRSLERGMQLWNAWRERTQDYQDELARIACGAMDRMGERIVAAAGAGQVFGNLREIYDLWVECSEAAWAERIASDEHARCFGAMVNALSDLCLHARSTPTDADGEPAQDLADEIDALREQQAGLRHELDLSRAQRGQDAEVIDALRRELEQLKQKLTP